MSAGRARVRASSRASRCETPPAIANDVPLDVVKSVQLQSFDDLAFICFIMVVVITAAFYFAGGHGPVLTILLSLGVVLTISLIQPYAISITSQGRMTVESLV